MVTSKFENWGLSLRQNIWFVIILSTKIWAAKQLSHLTIYITASISTVDHVVTHSFPLFPPSFCPGNMWPKSIQFLSRGSNPNCSLTRRTWSSKPVFLARSSEIFTQGWPSADRILITMFMGFDFSTDRFFKKSSVISLYISLKMVWLLLGGLLVKKVPTPKLDRIPCLSAQAFNSRHRSTSRLSLKTMVLSAGFTPFSL